MSNTAWCACKLLLSFREEIWHYVCHLMFYLSLHPSVFTSTQQLRFRKLTTTPQFQEGGDPQLLPLLFYHHSVVCNWLTASFTMTFRHNVISELYWLSVPALANPLDMEGNSSNMAVMSATAAMRWLHQHDSPSIVWAAMNSVGFHTILRAIFHSLSYWAYEFACQLCKSISISRIDGFRSDNR